METDKTEEYQKILNDIVHKQIIILGPYFTVELAKSIRGLTITQADNGQLNVTAQNPKEATQQLIERFTTMSNQLSIKIFKPILDEYLSAKPSALFSQTGENKP